MKDLADILKQAQTMKARMGEIQERAAAIEVEGKAGAGMIAVTLNGKGELKSVSIDPSLFSTEEREVVEDLIVAAHNDAKAKLEARMQEEVGKMASDMGLPPGFKLPF